MRVCSHVPAVCAWASVGGRSVGLALSVGACACTRAVGAPGSGICVRPHLRVHLHEHGRGQGVWVRPGGSLAAALPAHPCTAARVVRHLRLDSLAQTPTCPKLQPSPTSAPCHQRPPAAASWNSWLEAELPSSGVGTSALAHLLNWRTRLLGSGWPALNISSASFCEPQFPHL